MIRNNSETNRDLSLKTIFQVLNRKIRKAQYSSFVKHIMCAYMHSIPDLFTQGTAKPNGKVKRRMTYTPQHIANYFLDRAEIEGAPVTQLKLLKLIYIGYGWNLALTDKKLFTETIEAWKHGPVVPSIYHEFKDFGSNPIDRRSYDLDLDSFDFFAPQIPENDAETRLILDRVWSVYKNFTGWDLRQKTHEVDSPWNRVYNPALRSIPLKDSDIKEHYSQKIRGYLEAARAIHSAQVT